MPLSAQQLAAFHATELPQAQATTKRKTSGRGGTLTSLISEAGGTGGALGGAAIGASLGSVVPVLGTAVGGLAGALIGGFAGGTGGRAIENKVRDDQNFLGPDGSAKDALTEGAISGVLGAGPLRLLGAGKGLITKGAGKGLAGALTKDATQTAGATLSDAAVKSAPLKTSVAGKADALGDKLLGKSQFGVISKPGIRANDPAGTTKSLYSMGLTKGTDIERVAQGVTGGDGVLNKAVSSAVGDANPLQITHLPGSVETTIKKSGLTQSNREALTNEIMADVENINPADPNTALEIMRNLKARQQEYLGKGGTAHLPTSADIKRAKVIGSVHDEIENSLYKTAGANANLSKVLTPQLRDELVALHPNSPQWISHIDNKIMKSKTVGDLRSAQAPFVNATKLIAEGEGNAYSAGGQMVRNTAGIKDAIMGAVANVAKNPVTRAAGTALKSAAPMLPGGTGIERGAAGGLAGALGSMTAPTGKQIVRNEVLGKPISSLATTAQPADALSPEVVDPATDPMAQAAMTGMDGLSGSGLPDATTSAQDTASDPFNPANLQTNIRAILTNGGTMKDVSEYVGLVETVSKLQSSSGTGMTSATSTSLASSANGNNTLNQLESLFSNAGGGSGKVGGGVANVFSKVGLSGNTQIYNDLAASSVSQLAKALNGGGQVSDTDAAVVIQALPKITDSPAVAQAKFNALKARLQAAQQNTMQYAGVDTSNLGVQ